MLLPLRFSRQSICCDVLFLSNCYGEHRSASIIAKELKKIVQDIKILAAPLICGAADYTLRGINVVFDAPMPPSGGFPTRRFDFLLKDLFSGNVFLPIKYIRTLSCVKPRLVFVVGDVPLLLMAYIVFPKVPIFFLAPAKSDYIAPHYKIEKKFLKKIPLIVFTHDRFTAANMALEGINAVFLGNPMMDELEPKQLYRLKKPVVLLLPGSRKEAYTNFVRILLVVEKLPEDVSFVAALPQSFSLEEFKKYLSKKWVLTDKYLKFGKKKILLTRDFASAVHSADVTIGLAGTANEQSAGLGRPVVCFTGTGPQTTRARFLEQERLLGGALKFVEDFPKGVVEEVKFLLTNDVERKRRAKIGRERMGPSGGAARMARVAYHFLSGARIANIVRPSEVGGLST